MWCCVFPCFFMLFHVLCRIFLSFRFVASHVHRCQFASYASFPVAPGAGLDGKLGGAFLKRPAVHRKTETRKASLLAALDDLGKCRILDLSKGEALGSGFDDDTPKRLYTVYVICDISDISDIMCFFISSILVWPKMLIQYRFKSLNVLNTDFRHFLCQALCTIQSPSGLWIDQSGVPKPKHRELRRCLMVFLFCIHRGRCASSTIPWAGHLGTAAMRPSPSIFSKKHGARRMDLCHESANGRELSCKNVMSSKCTMRPQCTCSPLKPHLLRMLQGKATSHHFQFCRFAMTLRLSLLTVILFCQGLDMGYHHRSLFAQQKASRWISKSFLRVSSCFSLLSLGNGIPNSQAVLNCGAYSLKTCARGSSEENARRAFLAWSAISLPLSSHCLLFPSLKAQYSGLILVTL